MKFRSRSVLSILFLAIWAFRLSAYDQKTQMLRVTALKYRKKDADTPYRVDGETLPPGTILYYKLGCKKGAAGLHVGNKYQIEEGTDEDGMKVLSIYYKNPDEPVTEPTIVGVTCTIESVKAKTEGK
jgi:hypothetical protein